MNEYFQIQTTVLGKIGVMARTEGITVLWRDENFSTPSLPNTKNPSFRYGVPSPYRHRMSSATPSAVRDILEAAFHQLEEYFCGKRKEFSLPFCPFAANEKKSTNFQRTVWNALLDVPYGETWSYQKLAEYIGHPRSVRAVGNANAANPVPIFFPCHRIVRKNGDIGGYGLGLDWKQKLLEMESS